MGALLWVLTRIVPSGVPAAGRGVREGDVRLGLSADDNRDYK